MCCCIAELFASPTRLCNLFHSLLSALEVGSFIVVSVFRGPTLLSLFFLVSPHEMKDKQSILNTLLRFWGDEPCCRATPHQNRSRCCAFHHNLYGVFSCDECYVSVSFFSTPAVFFQLEVTPLGCRELLHLRSFRPHAIPSWVK